MVYNGVYYYCVRDMLLLTATLFSVRLSTHIVSNFSTISQKCNQKIPTRMNKNRNRRSVTEYGTSLYFFKVNCHVTLFLLQSDSFSKIEMSVT